MIERHLKESAATADALNTAPGGAVRPSPPLLLLGHPLHAVAAAAGVSPIGLSRMIRQDTAGPADQGYCRDPAQGRLTGGRFDGFVATQPLTGEILKAAKGR